MWSASNAVVIAKSAPNMLVQAAGQWLQKECGLDDQLLPATTFVVLLPNARALKHAANNDFETLLRIF